MTKIKTPITQPASQAGQPTHLAQTQTAPAQAQGVQKKPGAQEAADASLDRVDLGSLPKSLGNQQSPLTGLIASGIDALAKVYGLDGQQGALQVQLSTFGAAEAPDAAFSADSRKAATRQFVSLGFEREAAAKLVDQLAFVLGGLSADPGMKKSHREHQIQQEMDAFRRTLTDLKKAPLPERDAILQGMGEQLLGKSAELAERTKDIPASALPDSLKVVESRVRAVHDIVSLIRANVQTPVES